MYDPEHFALTNFQLQAILALPKQTCGPHGLRHRVTAPSCGAAAKERQGTQQHPGGGSTVASVLAEVTHVLVGWGGRVAGALSRGTRRRQQNKGQVLARAVMADKAPSTANNTAIEV
jgi:hypothetical protein